MLTEARKGWVEAVEGLVISEADSEISEGLLPSWHQSIKRCVNSRRGASKPVRSSSDRFCTLDICENQLYLWSMISGEIPFKGLKIRADGVGLLNDVVNYPLVCGEGARPAASQKKKIDDDIKNAKTMPSLYKQIVLSEADARKQLFLDLRIYGWTAFKVDVSLTMLDFRGRNIQAIRSGSFRSAQRLGRHAKFRFYVRGCDQVGAMR
ncbi:LOW QUALITY PROTEIN: hypothetical protein BC938DRAFT_479948 [Jimgerdemannia flammicorona]|uniref:Uncharacterized protein n=1 Tax=Jimgerdemannia flammicorona TaxID=994334 RepID=A0A433QJT1_9FUNG|nr:LOW QUALITY PROTEIN: hypothetical protein BC938DRAFT_479948 [Jimgerdemannia flammicorona]